MEVEVERLAAGAEVRLGRGATVEPGPGRPTSCNGAAARPMIWSGPTAGAPQPASQAAASQAATTATKPLDRPPQTALRRRPRRRRDGNPATIDGSRLAPTAGVRGASEGAVGGGRLGYRWRMDPDARPETAEPCLLAPEAPARGADPVSHEPEAVQVAERRLSLILDSAGEGIYGLDIDGRTTFVNPAAIQMTGYPPDELLGASQHDLLHHHHADGRPYDSEDCPILACMVHGAVRRVEDEVFWRKDGTSFPVSYVSTPIRDGEVVVGAVVIFSDVTARRQAETYHRAALRAAAERAASAAALRELQAALQPVVPSLPDTSLGVHYLPADDSAPIGGDLYDLQVLSDGSLHVAVVDVLGKGVSATKDALAVTHALRLLTMAGVSLDQVVAEADHLLSTNYPDLVATVAVGRYDPRTGHMALASGGHPPALVLGQEERRFLTGGGRPVGWPEAGSDGVEKLVLRPGESIVLYTDGLIESRRDILVGLERLRTLASDRAGLPPGDLARSLVDTVLAHAERQDDTLCLVLQRSPQDDQDLEAERRLGSVTPVG